MRSAAPGDRPQGSSEQLALYARHGVGHLWLVDPLERSLEALGNEGARWHSLGRWRATDAVRAAPFEQVAVALETLWLGQTGDSGGMSPGVHEPPPRGRPGAGRYSRP